MNAISVERIEGMAVAASLVDFSFDRPSLSLVQWRCEKELVSKV